MDLLTIAGKEEMYEFCETFGGTSYIDDCSFAQEGWSPLLVQKVCLSKITLTDTLRRCCCIMLNASTICFGKLLSPKRT